MSIWNRKKTGRHETAPAEHKPAERAAVGLFVDEDNPRPGPAAPQRKKVGRKVPTEPHTEVHAPRTAQPRPATGPKPVPPRPYVPEPPRRRYSSPPRKAMPAGPVNVPARLYPGYDGTAAQYARLMRLCDRLTGTTSSYSDPKAWPQHALTSGRAA